MARESRVEQLKKIHVEAISEFDRVHGVMSPERDQCIADRRFYSIAGAQWEGALADSNRPKYEFNKVHLAVMRVISEYRNNAITVDFVPKSGEAADGIADACDGLYRSDEADSSAEEAYLNAFEEAVGGGFGAWRLRAEYEDEYDPDDDRQRIRIEPIYDADSSVFFDLDAKRQDKADAKRCWVISSLTPEAYRERYNDDPVSWPKPDKTGYSFDWATPDIVYIAEYYRVEETRDRMRTYGSPTGEIKKVLKSELDDEPELVDELQATGWTLTKDRSIKRREVRKYIMSGGGILEDVGVIAGKNIPIVPVYGKRWFVDNVERCMGHVRLAKDAQRLKNLQVSNLAVIAAYSPIEKPIFTPDQIAGHELRWANDIQENFPYLTVNPLKGDDGQIVATGPTAYSKPPSIPPALAALIQQTEADMADLLGKPDAADEVVSNVSGKAIELVQARLDMQTYIYISNFARAMRRCGEIWLGMAKDIYVEEGRTMKAISASGASSAVTINKPVIDSETFKQVLENDISSASMDVVADVGPASSSKRESMVKNIVSMLPMTDDPEVKAILQSVALMNMDGEGLSDVREWLRKRMVSMGVFKPNDEEAELMKAQSGGEDPQVVLATAMANQADAEAAKARVDTIETMSKAELNRAKTLEIEAKIGASVLNGASAALDAGSQPPPYVAGV